MTLVVGGSALLLLQWELMETLAQATLTSFNQTWTQLTKMVELVLVTRLAMMQPFCNFYFKRALRSRNEKMKSFSLRIWKLMPFTNVFEIIFWFKTNYTKTLLKWRKNTQRLKRNLQSNYEMLLTSIMRNRLRLKN